MPRKYKPEANKICGTGLGFHIGNGKLHDTNGEKDKKVTSWRQVCPPIDKDNLGVVELEIDADQDKINWKFNGTKFAESVITSYLKSKNMVAFISMAHVDDKLDLNDKPAQEKPITQEEVKTENKSQQQSGVIKVEEVPRQEKQEQSVSQTKPEQKKLEEAKRPEI